MKKFVLLLLAFAFTMSLSAQNVNADYDRKALTVISVHHNDRFDEITDAYLAKYFPGGQKFDDNTIATRSITVPYNRYVYNKDNSADAYMRSHVADIRAELEGKGIPRDVIAKWFNRTPGGAMDLNLINKRADYNVTDQTYNIASSQALGEYLLHGEGIKLLDGSYILVVDHSVPQREETRNDNGRVTQVTWTTQAIGYLFKIAFGDPQREAVYNQWIYNTDDQATRDAKNKAWDKLIFPISLVAQEVEYSTGTFSPTSNSTDDTPALRTSVNNCSSVLISEFERKVPAWQVKTAIYKTRPILSKVGTKEGLSNMSRFQVREYILDEKGNVSTRNRGYVRATEVANNTHATKGESPMSRFYQIAGGKLEPGMELVQKPSLNFDVKALYYGGAAKGYGAEFDMLMGMSNGGSCSHIRIAGTYYKYAAGIYGNYQLNHDISAIGVRIGYGYGIRPFRQLELIPVVYILADFLDSKLTESQQKNSALTKAGWGAEAGVDVNITVFYPVKINAGAFYSAPFMGGEFWKVYREALQNMGQQRMGFTWRAGLVFEF